MKKPRILVVDDDPDICELLLMLLADWGYDCVAAANGQEAMREVEQAMPKMILLDMKMPVMNGAQFAKAFRDRFGRRVPLVVVTAAENARRSAEEVHADAWMGKPFAIEELLAIIRRFIEPSRSTEPQLA